MPLWRPCPACPGDSPAQCYHLLYKLCIRIVISALQPAGAAPACGDAHSVTAIQAAAGAGRLSCRRMWSARPSWRRTGWPGCARAAAWTSPPASRCPSDGCPVGRPRMMRRCPVMLVGARQVLERHGRAVHKHLCRSPRRAATSASCGGRGVLRNCAVLQWSPHHSRGHR